MPVYSLFPCPFVSYPSHPRHFGSPSAFPYFLFWTLGPPDFRNQTKVSHSLSVCMCVLVCMYGEAVGHPPTTLTSKKEIAVFKNRNYGKRDANGMAGHSSLPDVYPLPSPAADPQAEGIHMYAALGPVYTRIIFSRPQPVYTARTEHLEYPAMVST